MGAPGVHVLYYAGSENEQGPPHDRNMFPWENSLLIGGRDRFIIRGKGLVYFKLGDYFVQLSNVPGVLFPAGSGNWDSGMWLIPEFSGRPCLGIAELSFKITSENLDAFPCVAYLEPVISNCPIISCKCLRNVLSIFVSLAG